jgi:hypothetical protein
MNTPSNDGQRTPRPAGINDPAHQSSDTVPPEAGTTGGAAEGGGPDPQKDVCLDLQRGPQMMHDSPDQIHTSSTARPIRRPTLSTPRATLPPTSRRTHQTRPPTSSASRATGQLREGKATYCSAFPLSGARTKARSFSQCYWNSFTGIRGSGSASSTRGPQCCRYQSCEGALRNRCRSSSSASQKKCGESGIHTRVIWSRISSGWPRSRGCWRTGVPHE